MKSILLSSIEQTANALIAQAKEVQKHPEKDVSPSARPLRELQMQFSRFIQLPFSSTDRFMLFFISSYIDDIFSNLLAETPYSEEVKNAKEKLFYEIGGLLHQLSESYKEDKDEDLYRIYKDLVYVYLEKIDLLNSNNRGEL